MRWMTALLIGGLLGFVLPMAFGGQNGVWAGSWAGWGTIRPVENSPGLLFSVPLALGGAFALRRFFGWHAG